MAGLMYLAVIVAGAFAEFYVRGAVIVRGDAAATALNIVHLEPLYRLGFVGYLLDMALYVYVTMVLYELFRPVNRRQSLLSAAFSLVGSAVGAMTALLHFAPVLLLNGDAYLSAFPLAELQALALFCLKLHTYAYQVAIFLFAIHLALLARLILTSELLPRILGLLLLAGAVAYLIDCLANFLSPPLAVTVAPFILLPAIVGEGLLALWLLAAGVSDVKWRRAVDGDACRPSEASA